MKKLYRNKFIYLITVVIDVHTDGEIVRAL